MAETVVIAGSLAQNPDYGGHAWVFLQYLLGFRRLGWDVLFVDALTPEMCVDEWGRPTTFRDSWNVRRLVEVMRRFDLDDAYAVLHGPDGQSAGLSRHEVLERTGQAAFLLNVMGYARDEELLERARRRVFLDIDPGFGQMWRALGLADIFAGHDAFVTIGLNIGRPDCAIPTCGLDWITTLQPVVLNQWPTQSTPRAGARITSIGAWRGPFGPVELNGKTYGLRVHEFRKFVDLPRRCAARFEAALDIHSADGRDVEVLREHGWHLVAPKAVTGDPWLYQAYVQASAAELMIAKNMYVQTRGGWFSDRSICFLASGRPVIAQDTGLAGLLPLGEGLLAFTAPDEAVGAVESLLRSPEQHARAARDIAESVFNSDRVLTALLAKLGYA